MVIILNELKNKLHNFQKIKDKNKEIETLFEIANYHYKNKEFENAKRVLKQIILIDKNTFEVNYFYAIILLNENKDSDAKKYLKSEIKINPNNNRAKLILEKLEINSNFPIATIFISILFIFIYFYFTKNFEMNYSTILKYSLNSYNFNIFSAITSIFIHANLIHLILNTSLFLMFGFYLEKYIGSFNFLIVFFISGIIGNLSQLFITQNYFIIGASSAIFGILGSITMREPLLKTKVLAIINIPIIFLVGVIFSIGSALSFYSTEIFIIGDYAHLFGFLSGILITAILYYKTTENFYNWLAIAFGFWIILITIKDFTLIFNFENIFKIIISLILGIFLITYSYLKLKLNQQINLEKEVTK